MRSFGIIHYMQEIGVEKTLVQAVLDGRKTIEGHLGTPKHLKLRVGDRLSLREDVWQDGKIITSTQVFATAEITQLLYFVSFAEMFGSINYNAALPEAKSTEEAREVYETFYSLEDEAEYGVVAITFKVQR
jgi:ASC-1-like (ASCH) protein